MRAITSTMDPLEGNNMSGSCPSSFTKKMRPLTVSCMLLLLLFAPAACGDKKAPSMRTKKEHNEAAAATDGVGFEQQEERVLLRNSYYTDHALYRETFEPGTTRWRDTFDGNARTEEYTGGGISGRRLRVSYPPSDIGSPRLVRRFDLAKAVDKATLSFDMKLHSQFEFVKGGKMHGLGGGTGTTGCEPIDPAGWSVRMMWASSGAPFLYIYHQDRDSRCGDCYASPSGFTFRRVAWYRVDIQVTMNSSPGAADGRATLYVDGRKLVDARNLRLTGTNKANIDQFLFSTFYGGSKPEWAPSKKTYAYFDNFTVNRGIRVTGTRGIYSPSKRVCCPESCGSCGGSGCSGLPGGSSNCCSGSVSNSAPLCSRSSAPCKF